MNELVIVARFSPQARERVNELLAAGPPLDFAETSLERHAVYQTGDEVVFVFQGPDAEWQVEDLVDDFRRPVLLAALGEWRPLHDGEPRIAQKVFEWSRGRGGSS